MPIQREPIFEMETRKIPTTLQDFAISSQISEDKVWELIEEGQVSARFVGDSILIMPDQPEVERIPSFSKFSKEPILSPVASPHPDFSANEPHEIVKQLDDFVEDNHDILVFAQDALSRHTELSKELLATKDELIRLKDERIQFLNDLLQQKEKEIRILNREIEEYATLRNFSSR